MGRKVDVKNDTQRVYLRLLLTPRAAASTLAHDGRHVSRVDPREPQTLRHVARVSVHSGSPLVGHRTVAVGGRLSGRCPKQPRLPLYCRMRYVRLRHSGQSAELLHLSSLVCSDIRYVTDLDE